MLHVAVHSGHGLLRASLEALVLLLGFSVTPLEEADVALWELCTCGYTLSPPPPRPTLALIYADERQALELLRLGYRGYVHQRDDHAQLRLALGCVARGELWAERHLLGKAFGSRRAAQVTPREREVLALVARGLSNKEIAQRLGITENTVKGYVSKLLDKLEFKSRAGMIAHHYGEHVRVEDL